MNTESIGVFVLRAREGVAAQQGQKPRKIQNHAPKDFGRTIG